jgi:hypothetical protein
VTIPPETGCPAHRFVRGGARRPRFQERRAQPALPSRLERAYGRTRQAAALDAGPDLHKTFSDKKDRRIQAVLKPESLAA